MAAQYSRYTKEFINQFLVMYDNGATEKQIRKSLGLSTSAIQRLRVYAKGDRDKPYHSRGRSKTYEDRTMPARFGMYSTYKRGAVTRGLEFSIPFEYFNELISQVCVYCGCEGTIRRHGAYSFVGNGVDRIDSSLGYTFENTTTACSVCNMMKRTMTSEDFLEHCRKVADFNA